MAPTANENGRPLAPPPRGGRRDSHSDDDDNPIIDDDTDEENEDSNESESDSDLEIPPDPAHEQRMRALRAENAFLLHVTEQQDAVMEEMRLRVSEIQAATERRRRELEEFRELRRARVEEAEKKAEDEEPGNGDGCQPPETGKKGGNDDKDGSSPVLI